MAGGTKRVRSERGGCLHAVEDLWFKLKAWGRRRRNSYKLYLFFHLQGWVCLGVFIFALVLYSMSWSALNTSTPECTTAWQTTYDSELQSQTVDGRQALVCDGESNQAVTCELADIRTLLNGILVSGVAILIQGVLSFNIAYAYNKFANLPQELLQHGKSGRMVAFFGAICKKGPWFGKLLHIFQGLTLAVLVIIMVIGDCSMDLSRTYNCANYQADCEYIKLQNCRYYYGTCAPSENDLLNCYSLEGRAAFSGRIDARLVHFSSCIRCALLAADAENAAAYDEFWLLNESDKGTDTWQCSSVADSCFGTTSTFSTIVCNCQTEATDIDFTTIGCARLLSDGGTHAPDARNLTSMQKPRGKEASESIATAQTAAAYDDLNARESASPRRLDAECTTSSGETNLCAQGCTQGPSTPEGFYFDSQDCTDAGSTYLIRQYVLYVYVAAVVWCNLTFLGQAVRLALRVEPWFLNPRAPRENIVWKLIRIAGPPKE